MRIRAIFGAFFAAAVLFGTTAALAEGSKGTVTGRVVDVRGKPIAGARVSATGETDAEATTDDEGQFRLALDPGEYRLQFEAEGHASATIRQLVKVQAGKETKLGRRVTLPGASPGSVVRGSVFDKAGRTITGAKVHLERIPEEEGQPVSSVKMDSTSDSMGLFTFRLPKGDGRYKLTASHEKFATTSVTVDVTDGAIVNAPPLTMGPGGS